MGKNHEVTNVLISYSINNNTPSIVLVRRYAWLAIVQWSMRSVAVGE